MELNKHYTARIIEWAGQAKQVQHATGHETVSDETNLRAAAAFDSLRTFIAEDVDADPLERATAITVIAERFTAEPPSPEQEARARLYAMRLPQPEPGTPTWWPSRAGQNTDVEVPPLGLAIAPSPTNGT